MSIIHEKLILYSIWEVIIWYDFEYIYNNNNKSKPVEKRFIFFKIFLYKFMYLSEEEVFDWLTVQYKV